MRLLFGILTLILSLYGENTDYSDEPSVVQKVIYTAYEQLPKRLFVGELFSVTYKTLSTEDHYDDIHYDFGSGENVTLLGTEPLREHSGRHYLDTFYFVATGKPVVLPAVEVSLRFNRMRQYPTTIQKRRIETVTLNPQPRYANILAEQFSISNYKTASYNHHENILVFSAVAKRSDLKTFRLETIRKQGFESLEQRNADASMTYYAVIPKKMEQLIFSYFDLNTKQYEKILIPIIVDNDTVSTQSDLKPTEHRHTKIKIAVAAAIGVLALMLFIFRRKFIYMVVVAAAAAYVLFAAVPIKHVCIKKDAPIYLLPMNGGTVFELAKNDYNLEVQGSVNDYIKVKLHNDKIGWVHHEDLCIP